LLDSLLQESKPKEYKKNTEECWWENIPRKCKIEKNSIVA